MKITRCNHCKGTKTILSLGGLRKSCFYCSGVGYIEEMDDNMTNDHDNEVNTVVIEKKRGRPRKETCQTSPETL